MNDVFRYTILYFFEVKTSLGVPRDIILGQRISFTVTRHAVTRSQVKGPFE
jgi:hypothetical protein